jgi:hypothetical protein
MTVVLAQWRATYAPGEWIVLSGPTSLVVIQPLAAEWSTLVGTLWEEVLASSSIVELADQLVAFGIADMPSFGAFFWTEDGMRSLVRGGVVVRDADTGQIVADGQGVQTWSEVGLGGLERIVVETPSPAPEAMELPLVVGAVHASSLILDASPQALVSSAQGSIANEVVSAGEASNDRDSTDDPQPHDGASDPDAEDAPIAEEAPDAEDDSDIEDGPDTESYPDTEDYVPTELASMENADTELMSTPILIGPEPTAALPQQQVPASARIILSDGNQLDLVGTMRIGRAPAPAPAGADAELVTVASPNQDISRTHVQISGSDGKVLVTDLHSTNGTILVRPGPDMARERLAPGEAVPVPLGSLLELGDGVSVLVEPPH